LSHGYIHHHLPDVYAIHHSHNANRQVSRNSGACHEIQQGNTTTHDAVRKQRGDS
jgi:hypothetical protein